MKPLALAVAAILAVCVCADDSYVALTNALRIVGRREEPTKVKSVFERLSRLPGMTAERFGCALVDYAKSCTNSTDVVSRNSRLRVLRGLGDYGTESAVPFLEQVLISGDEASCQSAAHAYMTLAGKTGRDVEFLAKVEGFCGKYDDVTRRIIYGDLMKSCTNITSTIERRRSVCAFVLARLADETANADVVDDILLAADKDYATSERRKAFLSRVTDDKCLFQSRRCELEKRLENLTAKPMLATQDE